MTNERTVGGVAVAERMGSKALGVRDVKPLKMQDASYLRTVRSIERRNIERLKSIVPAASEGGKGKRIVFAEDAEEGSTR